MLFLLFILGALLLLVSWDVLMAGDLSQSGPMPPVPAVIQPLRPLPLPIPHFSMLSYTLLFIVIALIAGVLGFGVIAGTAAAIAKVLFIVFLVLVILSLFRGRRA